MITVRDIITEALNRSNLVSRRQQAPADMMETGLRLLKGIAAAYSKDNLLQFLVAEIGPVSLDKTEYVVGDVDPDAPYEYYGVDLPAENLGNIVKMYWRGKDPTNLGTWVELSYASAADFDAYPRASGVYTWQNVNDKQAILKTKLLPDPRTEFKIVYNKKWSFDLDSELRIPDEYGELFTVALTHKFAVTFPRLSTEQVNILAKELETMEKTVRTATRAVKYISRGPRRAAACDMAAFVSGRFISY